LGSSKAQQETEAWRMLKFSTQITSSDKTMIVLRLSAAPSQFSETQGAPALTKDESLVAGGGLQPQEQQQQLQQQQLQQERSPRDIHSLKL